MDAFKKHSLFKQMQVLTFDLYQASFVCVVKVSQNFDAFQYDIQIMPILSTIGLILKLNALAGHNLMHMYIPCEDKELASCRKLMKSEYS